jgi:hypothetical protein
MIVVLVLMTSCHVSEKPKAGPVNSHAKTNTTARPKAQLVPEYFVAFQEKSSNQRLIRLRTPYCVHAADQIYRSRINRRHWGNIGPASMPNRTLFIIIAAVVGLVILALVYNVVGKRRDAQMREASTEALVQLLRDPNGEMRGLAAEVLIERRDPASVPLIGELLRDSDSSVRHMAARTLGQIGLPSAAEPLILALGDPDDSVVPAVAQAIGLVKAAGATEGLIRALGRGDVSARTAAAWALGQTRGTGGIPALLNCSATSIQQSPGWPAKQ